MVSRKELLPEPDMRSSGRGIKSGRIPVEWGRATRFVCTIKILAESAESAGIAPGGPGPVLLRVSEAVADCCRLEIFCGETGLCGVSAGY